MALRKIFEVSGTCQEHDVPTIDGGSRIVMLYGGRIDTCQESVLRKAMDQDIAMSLS